MTVRLKAASVRSVLAFVDTAGGAIRVRWSARGPETRRAWRCDACPDGDCDHIDAVRRLIQQETQ